MTCNRLGVLGILLEPRAGGQHLDVGQHDLRGRVFRTVGWTRGDDDVDMRPREDVTGHTDHFVHPDRHRAFAAGMIGGSPLPLLGCQLARQNRLVADDRVNQAAPDD